jgi:hypothetical protein
MSEKPPKKPKLTDAERYKRFLDMAEEVGASEDTKDFDQAFTKVVPPKEAHQDHAGTPPRRSRSGQ